MVLDSGGGVEVVEWKLQEAALGSFLPHSLTFVTSPYPTDLSLAKSIECPTSRNARLPKHGQGGKSGSEQTGGLPASTKGYSAEARTYHARYDEVRLAPTSNVRERY